MMRKTVLMRRVEERYRTSLDRLLPELYNRLGLPGMADELGVSRSTVWYWLLRYGVNLRKVALAPDETLEIRKSR